MELPLTQKLQDKARHHRAGGFGVLKGGLCETCLKPGHCCRELFLSGGINEKQIDVPMSAERAEHLALEYGLPFRPLYQTERGWMWWCPKLDQATGRCTDYENRPPLCRNFAAGSGPLCVHHQAQPERLAV